MVSTLLFKKRKVNFYIGTKNLKKTALAFRDHRSEKDSKYKMALEKCLDEIKAGNGFNIKYKSWAVFNLSSELVEITDDLKGFCEKNNLNSLSLLYATNRSKDAKKFDLGKPDYKGYYVREVSHIISGIAFPLLSELVSEEEGYVQQIVENKRKHDFWIINDLEKDSLYQAKDVSDFKEYFGLSNQKPLYATSTITSENTRKRPHFKQMSLTRSVDILNNLIELGA